MRETGERTVDVERDDGTGSRSSLVRSLRDRVVAAARGGAERADDHAADRPTEMEAVAGLTDDRVARLRAAGVPDVAALRGLRPEDLEEVDGVSRALAGRVNAEVGDRFAGEVDPRPVLDAVDETRVWVPASADEAADGCVTVDDDGEAAVVTDADGGHHRFDLPDGKGLFVDASDGWPSEAAVESGAVEREAGGFDGVAVCRSLGEVRRSARDRIETLVVSERDWRRDGRLRVDGGWGAPTLDEGAALSPEKDHVVTLRYADGMDVVDTGSEGRSVLTALGEGAERGAGRSA